MINMLVAVDICTEDYAPVWNIVGFVVNVIKIGIPIVLILFGMIDLGKAVISGKEDEQKKATKLLGKRFLYAVGVFASVWIVTFVLNLASETIGKNNDSYNYDEASWKKCWSLISNGSIEKEEAKKCYEFESHNNTIYVWEKPSVAKNKDGYKLVGEVNSEGDCLMKNTTISQY